MGEVSKELIDEKFRGVYARIDANHDVTQEMLKSNKEMIEKHEKFNQQYIEAFQEIALTHQKLSLLYEQNQKKTETVYKYTSVWRWFEAKPIRFFIILGLLLGNNDSFRAIMFDIAKKLF